MNSVFGLFQAAAFTQNIDQLHKTKIKDIVAVGVTRAADMRLHLEYFVKEMFGKDRPPRTNTRFYTRQSDVLNCIQAALKELACV